MRVGRTYQARTRQQWRSWLSKHHLTAREIWLVRYRKDTGKPSVSYEESVEEALCYGWIDSQERRLDSKRTAQRFTPRSPGSNWSLPNRARVRQLIASRKMTRAGRAAFAKERCARSLLQR